MKRSACKAIVLLVTMLLPLAAHAQTRSQFGRPDADTPRLLIGAFMPLHERLADSTCELLRIALGRSIRPRQLHVFSRGDLSAVETMPEYGMGPLTRADLEQLARLVNAAATVNVRTTRTPDGFSVHATIYFDDRSAPRVIEPPATARLAASVDSVVRAIAAEPRLQRRTRGNSRDEK